ncbi:glutamate--cysteine ligase [Alteromonas flava]|uniref:glutamate--cysteine ligase n=1 Tax=Alteromonas flava TaxID=2048003 RepID=UPI000C2866AF|nr:glutamate--cysteine ligase [Alteromonas flava]
MSNHPLSLEKILAGLDTAHFRTALTGIKHGVEREALRITPQGKLSQQAHPQQLGSALTHDSITTDFSEALLEFITPPEEDPHTTLAQLSDIHKFVLSEMGDEALWPMSMPCYVDSEDEIPIAQYGTSNIARMKSTYRQGLKNRYGAMMQAISGIHFNFSLPESFWQLYAELKGSVFSPAFVSQQYFDLIRNYRRWCWLIPYLYGASPALCGSFLRGKKHNFDFQQIGKGTLYLPYATSLRMSDLGYTNSQQSSLHVCYNNLSDYVASVRKAIRTPSAEYARFAAGEQGVYEQLNSNILQIENELYSPIRPKQVARSLEKPTDALESRGVAYVEVRALDVDPMQPVGISLQQFYFLDVFLLSCLLTESPDFTQQAYTKTERNIKRVVTQGRDPALTLLQEGQDQTSNEVPLQQWAISLFETFAKVAKVLDSASATSQYSAAVAREFEKITDSGKTPSAQILATLQSRNVDNGQWGLELSRQYKASFLSQGYQHFDQAFFEQQSRESLQQQKIIEANDKEDFDAFLKAYFAR